MEKHPTSIPKLISFSIFSLFCIGLVVWFSPLFSGKQEYYEAKAKGQTADVTFGNGKLKIKAEVVKSTKDMAEGLSGRYSLAAGYGMFFDLGTPAQTLSFWMKGMRFKLDMIWILDGKIVGIDRNIPYPKKNEQPVILQSPGKVSNVLEIVPGQTGQISVGDAVAIR